MFYHVSVCAEWDKLLYNHLFVMFLECGPVIYVAQLAPKKSRLPNGWSPLRGNGEGNTTHNKQHRHWMVECLQKGWIVTLQYLQGLHIFMIIESTIATMFYSCLSSWGISSRAAEFHFFQQAHSWPPLWRMIEFPSTLCGLMPNLQNNTNQIP